MNEISQQSSFWVGVVSASHVKYGVVGGFAKALSRQVSTFT
ncbi:hypothetical protein J2T13_002555 [Paenibacillus sp. DS2015]